MHDQAERIPENRVIQRRSRIATLLLGLSIFATGFCGLVSEFILSTVSSYILGNSVEQFSVIIALMMLMMGLAGAVQRLVSGTLLIEKFITIEILLAVLGGFAPLAIYAAYGLMEDHFRLVLYFFVMALGFLIGFELPLVLRINAAYVPHLRSNLAVILSLDYVGGFIGALIWTQYLLKALPLTEISFLIASLNFVIACVAFVYFVSLGQVRRWQLPGALMVLTACVLWVGFVHNRGWSTQLEQHLYDDRIVFAETTRYQRLVMTYNRHRDDYRLFLNGNLQFSSVDEAVYHEQLVHPAMTLAARRERVLILGGGDGLALREVLKYPDVVSVTLVDLDPRMTQLAATHPVLVRLNHGAFADARVRVEHPPGVSGDGWRPLLQETDRTEQTKWGERPETVTVARVEVVNIDADRFVAAIPGLWDVVIIDFPDPNSVELSKLYSREFYRKLRRVLAPDAVVVLQATSPYHAREAFLCILRTLRSAGFATLPYHDNVPSFGSWGWTLAWDREEISPQVRARIAAIRTLSVETRYLTPDVFRSALVFGKGRLHSQYKGVNTLMHPLLLELYLHESWLVE